MSVSVSVSVKASRGPRHHLKPVYRAQECLCTYGMVANPSKACALTGAQSIRRHVVLIRAASLRRCGFVFSIEQSVGAGCNFDFEAWSLFLLRENCRDER